MPAPKQRTSRSRRTHWKPTPPNLVLVVTAGQRYLIPRRPTPAYQRGVLPPE